MKDGLTASCTEPTPSNPVGGCAGSSASCSKSSGSRSRSMPLPAWQRGGDPASAESEGARSPQFHPLKKLYSRLLATRRSPSGDSEDSDEEEPRAAGERAASGPRTSGPPLHLLTRSILRPPTATDSPRFGHVEASGALPKGMAMGPDGTDHGSCYSPYCGGTAVSTAADTTCSLSTGTSLADETAVDREAFLPSVLSSAAQGGIRSGFEAAGGPSIREIWRPTRGEIAASRGDVNPPSSASAPTRGACPQTQPRMIWQPTMEQVAASRRRSRGRARERDTGFAETDAAEGLLCRLATTQSALLSAPSSSTSAGRRPEGKGEDPEKEGRAVDAVSACLVTW
jgi:hypothetical protein